MRCLTLADALRTRGGTTTFLCAPLADTWASVVRDRGHALVERSPDHEWTRADLPATTSWVVVDHYALGAAWETAIRPDAGHVLAIDDLADRDHACDVLLDQNYLPDRARDYAGRVPTACRLLLGPEWALVRPEYAAARDTVQRVHGRVGRVLVFFGGSDPVHLTERALEALSQPGLDDLDVDIVCSVDRRRHAALDARAAARGRTRVFGPQPHLAPLMCEADVALGAGGSTTWERLCLGLPALVVTVAANQEHVAAAMAQDRLIVLLGRAADVTAGQMADAMRRMRAGQDWPDVARGMQVCDGAGAERVADVMYRVSAGVETVV